MVLWNYEVKNGRIIYKDNKYKNEDGTPFMGRKPEIFDFTDLAIMYVTKPADDVSQVVEINNKNILEGIMDKKILM